MLKKLTCLFVLTLFCALPLQAAQIIRYVDPDATGAANGTTWTDAYTSLSAWEAAEQTDLDTANNYMTCYCRSSAGTDDTTVAEIIGWITSATDYIEIIGADFPANGVYDDIKYVLKVTNSANLGITEDHVRIHKLQIAPQKTTTATTKGITILNQVAGNSILIDSCIIKGTTSSIGSFWGISIEDTDDVVDIINTVVSGFNAAADTGNRGISLNTGTTVNIYNCTVSDCQTGIRTIIAGTETVKNCAVFDNEDDFAGTFTTIDYCASDDGDGTNAENFTAEATDWNAVFTNYASGDFSLKNYTTSPCCVGQGTDNPGSGLYSDDIIDAARSSTWDIGAFEYVAAGGAPPQIIRLMDKDRGLVARQ